MPLREGMLVRNGLDPDKVLYKTARVLEERETYNWLPFALASIYTLLAVANGCKQTPKTSELLRSWGLSYDASRLDDALVEVEAKATENALRNFFG